MIQFLAAALAAATPPARVTLSGETVEAGGSDPDTAVAVIKIDQDGNVYRIVNSVETQVDVADDWIRPTDRAPGTYEVRYTNLIGDALTDAPAAEDAWFALSTSDAVFQLNQAGAGSVSATFDLQIRRGTNTLASASYTLTAQVI